MGGRMNRTAVVIQAPRCISVRREEMPTLEADRVAVRTRLSAVSAGTELLFYRGDVPRNMPMDSDLPALCGPVQYPLRYGYAAVGRVVGLGPEVGAEWAGRRVFCFHPHASLMDLGLSSMVPIPEDVDDRDALFLASLETALTLVWDGQPLAGETVAVFGQGVIGLLAVSLLACHPLRSLLTVDPIARRREASLSAGAHASFDPRQAHALTSRISAESGDAMADLVFELSGRPSTLNAAIAVCGFGSRVVIGSWYGTQPAALDFGGRFHRNRIRLISSQVSTLPTHMTARWDKARRREAVWDLIRSIKPSRFITHEVAVQQAADAYELLDRRPEDVLQVVFTYGEG